MKGLETRARLDATHCLYIGLLAKLRREYTLALEWLKEARRLAKTDRTVDVPIVQAELAEMIREVSPVQADFNYQRWTEPTAIQILKIAARQLVETSRLHRCLFLYEKIEIFTLRGQ